MGGQKLASDTEVQSAIRQRLRQQPASFYQEFRKLLIDGINVQTNLDNMLKMKR